MNSLQKAYKDIAKQLIPTILFPSDIECKKALEEYLSKHAPHYIDSIDRNNWASKFEDSLLPEVSEILD